MKRQILMWLFCIQSLGNSFLYCAADVALNEQWIRSASDDDEDDLFALLQAFQAPDEEDDVAEKIIVQTDKTYAQYEADLFATQGIKKIVDALHGVQQIIQNASDDQALSLDFVQSMLQKTDQGLSGLYAAYQKQKLSTDVAISSAFKKIFVTQCGLYVRCVQLGIRRLQVLQSSQSLDADSIIIAQQVIKTIVHSIESMEEKYFPHQNEFISQEVNQVIGLPVLGRSLLPVFAEYIHNLARLSDEELSGHKDVLLTWMQVLQWFVQEQGAGQRNISVYQGLMQQSMSLMIHYIDVIVQFDMTQSQKNMQGYVASLQNAVQLYTQVLPICSALLDVQYYATSVQVQERIAVIQKQVIPAVQKEAALLDKIVQIRSYFTQTFVPEQVAATVQEFKQVINEYAQVVQDLKQSQVSAIAAFAQVEYLVLSGDFCLALALYYWHVFLQDKKDGFLLIHSRVQAPDTKIDKDELIAMCQAGVDVLTQDTHRYALSALYEQHDIATLLVYAYAFYVQAGKQEGSSLARLPGALVSLEMMHALKEFGPLWKKYFELLQICIVGLQNSDQAVDEVQKNIQELVHVIDTLSSQFTKGSDTVQRWFGMQTIDFKNCALQLLTQYILEQDFSGDKKIQYAYLQIMQPYLAQLTDTQRRLVQKKVGQLQNQIPQEHVKSVQKKIKDLVRVQDVSAQASAVTVHSSAQAPASLSIDSVSSTSPGGDSVDALYAQAETLSHQGRFYESARLYKQAFDKYTESMHTQKDSTKLAHIKTQMGLAQTRYTALFLLGNIVSFQPVFIAGMHIPSMYIELHSQITVSGDDIKMIPQSVIKNGVDKDTVQDFADFLRKYCVYSQLKNKKISVNSVYKKNTLDKVSGLSDTMVATVNAIEEAVDTYIEDVVTLLQAGTISISSTVSVPVSVVVHASAKQVQFVCTHFPVALFTPLFDGASAVASAFVGAIQLLKPGTDMIHVQSQSFVPGNDPDLIVVLEKVLLELYVYGAYEQVQQAEKIYEGIKSTLSGVTDVTTLSAQFEQWTDQYIQAFALLQGDTDSAQYYAEQVDKNSSGSKISYSDLVEKYVALLYTEYAKNAGTWLVGDPTVDMYNNMLMKINGVLGYSDEQSAQAVQNVLVGMYEKAGNDVMNNTNPDYKIAAYYYTSAAAMYHTLQDDKNGARVKKAMYKAHILGAANLIAQYLAVQKNGVDYTDGSGKKQHSTWQNVQVMSQLAGIPGLTGASAGNADMVKVYGQVKNYLVESALLLEAALSFYQGVMQDVSQSQYDTIAQTVRTTLSQNKIDIDPTQNIDASKPEVRQAMLSSIAQSYDLVSGNDQQLCVWIGIVYSCVAYQYLQDFLGGVTTPMNQDAFMKKWQDFVTAQQAFVQNKQQNAAAYLG